MIAKNIEIDKYYAKSLICVVYHSQIRFAHNVKIMSNFVCLFFHKDLPLLQILIHKDLPLMQILIHKDLPLIQILTIKDFFSMFLFLIKDHLLIRSDIGCRWTAPSQKSSSVQANFQNETKGLSIYSLYLTLSKAGLL